VANVPEVAAWEEALPESVAVAVAETVPESLRPSVQMPSLPPPSEELVPVAIGVTLDEKDFPLARPAALDSGPERSEHGLDRGGESMPMPIAGEIVGEEDELEFFGRMSNTLGLEMVE
jgi:hypothetical protein